MELYRSNPNRNDDLDLGIGPKPMKMNRLTSQPPAPGGEDAWATLPSATFHHYLPMFSARQAKADDNGRTDRALPCRTHQGESAGRAAGKVEGYAHRNTFRSLILAAAISTIPAASFAGVFVSIGIGAPPSLPVYVKPVAPPRAISGPPLLGLRRTIPATTGCPAPGCSHPTQRALWTPGYWGWGEGGYLWHTGYWGRHVGFYGGVNYGFGYFWPRL